MSRSRTTKTTKKHRQTAPPTSWQRPATWSLTQKLLAGAACIVLLVAAWFAAAAISFQLTPATSAYTFGTSFSKRQSESFGLDWRANYTALLDDLGIRSFRLMSYWDDLEWQRGIIDFTDLDWQMDEAAKRNAKVSLAVGLRQPRWPECHEPAWAVNLSKDEWRKALYGYMEQVIKRYEHHPALETFQLENEAFAWWFGDCREQPDRQRLREEFELVKSWTDVPIWMSLSDQYGVPTREPIADSYGYSLYTKVYNNVLPGTYIDPSPPLWYHLARARVLTTIYATPLFVHELQLEPWGAKPIPELTREEQDQTMDIEQIRYNILFGRKLGFDHVFTWGSEWWYWRLTQGDSSVWDTVREAVRDSASGSDQT